MTEFYVIHLVPAGAAPQRHGRKLPRLAGRFGANVKVRESDAERLSAGQLDMCSMVDVA